MALLLLLPARAMAQELVADLTTHIVEVTSRYAGAEIVVFGAVEGGGDIVITVRGPPRDIVVRRKARIAGIWLNARGMTFAAVPGYYEVLSGRPVEQIIAPRLRRLDGIGIDAVRLAVALDETPASSAELSEFRGAFVAGMERQGLYVALNDQVRFLGHKLFRATVALPSNAPVGTYIATVYLIRRGAVIETETLPLAISRSGLAAEIHDFADNHALAFGIFAVLAAAMAGWAASALLRTD